MALVLKFARTNTNPFDVLIRQVHQLHVDSLHQYILNKKLKVGSDVKNTAKELALKLENNVIKSEGRFVNSELLIDA